MSPDQARLTAEISEFIRGICANVGAGAEISGDSRLGQDLELDSRSLGQLADQIRSRYGPAADGFLPFLAEQGAGLRIAELAEHLVSMLQEGKSADGQASRSGQRDGSGPGAAPNRHQPRNDNAAVLSEYAPGASRHLLRLPGGDVEVFTAGDGPPLVLMHPLNIGAGVFAWQFADLADRYHVICVHNPGVGATTWNEDLTLGGLAWLQREVLLELSVAPPFHVLGACFGGTVAQEFVLLHQAECASLVLVGSYPPGDSDGGPRSLPVVAKEEFDLMCRAGGQGLEGERAVMEDLLLRSESMSTWFGLAYLQIFADKPNFQARLPEITVPTLILRGQLDTMMGLRHAASLQGAIPGAQVAELADTGHFPYLTHRANFGSLLVPFLAGAGQESPVAGDV